MSVLNKALVLLTTLVIGASTSAQGLVKKYESPEGLNWYNDTKGYGFRSLSDRMDIDGDQHPELVLETVSDAGGVAWLVVGFETTCDESECTVVEKLKLEMGSGGFKIDPSIAFMGFAEFCGIDRCSPSCSAGCDGGGLKQAVLVSGDPVERIYVVDPVTGEALFVFPQLATNKVAAAGRLRFALLDVDGDDRADVVVGDPQTRTVQVWGVAGAATASEEEIELVLSRLIQNFPNPFRASTSIPYVVDRAGAVSLEIFDVMGRRVRRLVSKNHVPGSYSTRWDGRDDTGAFVSSGAYFYQLRVGDWSGARQMIRID